MPGSGQNSWQNPQKMVGEKKADKPKPYLEARYAHIKLDSLYTNVGRMWEQFSAIFEA